MSYKVIPPEERKLIDLKKRSISEMKQVVKDLVDSDIDSFEIIQTIINQYPVTEERVKAEINSYINKRKKNLPSYDINTIISLHARRYESIYRKCIGLEDLWNDPDTNKASLIAMFNNSIVALRKKEEVLGLHKKSVKRKISESVVKITKREIKSHNFDNLTLEEKIELRKLLQKARIMPIEGFHTVEISQTSTTETYTYHNRKEETEIGLIDVLSHMEEIKTPKVVFTPIKVEGAFESKEKVINKIKEKIIQEQQKATYKALQEKEEREKNG